MATEHDTDADYTYVYEPGAPAIINVEASMAMDPLRSRMSQERSEEMLTARFRERDAAGPGPAHGNKRASRGGE